MNENPRIARAVELRLSGLPLRDIAHDIGVSPEMVRRYLNTAKAGGFGLNVQITGAKGIDGMAAARAIRTYLDSIGLNRIGD